jgi:hypothetical protein
MSRPSVTGGGYSRGGDHPGSTAGTNGSPTHISSRGEENDAQEDYIRAISRRAWRRVSSTHSLEDILLEESAALLGDNGQRSLDRRKSPVLTSIFLFILGIICILLGCTGLAACWLTVYHCYPTSTWSKASCDSTILSWYHRTVIQGCIHGIILPILHGISLKRPLSGWIRPLAFACSPIQTHHMSLIHCLFGSEHIEDLVIRQIAFIKEHYPYWNDLEPGFNQGQLSDSFLYTVTLIPVLCGPVTLMAIAVNWFCMKIFKHNR